LRTGVFHALTKLQEITQRTILSNNGHILIPSHPDGSGVDALAATLSTGPIIKVIAVKRPPQTRRAHRCHFAHAI
jgi:hypothetical protein